MKFRTNNTRSLTLTFSIVAITALACGVPDPVADDATQQDDTEASADEPAQEPAPVTTPSNTTPAPSPSSTQDTAPATSPVPVSASQPTPEQVTSEPAASDPVPSPEPAPKPPVVTPPPVVVPPPVVPPAPISMTVPAGAIVYTDGMIPACDVGQTSGCPEFYQLWFESAFDSALPALDGLDYDFTVAVDPVDTSLFPLIPTDPGSVQPDGHVAVTPYFLAPAVPDPTPVIDPVTGLPVEPEPAPQWSAVAAELYTGGGTYIVLQLNVHTTVEADAVSVFTTLASGVIVAAP